MPGNVRNGLAGLTAAMHSAAFQGFYFFGIAQRACALRGFAP